MNLDGNIAVTRLTKVPPALIEAVSKDASSAQPVIRAMALIQLHELHSLRHTLSPAQRMQLVEVSAKLGDMVPKQAAQAGGGGAVTINFIRSNEQAVVIEAESRTITEQQV